MKKTLVLATSALWTLTFLVPPAAQAQQAKAGTQEWLTIQAARQGSSLPPRVAEAKRFLAQRGWPLARHPMAPFNASASTRIEASTTAMAAGTPATPTWQSLGPQAVLTPSYGLVTGRVSALALDPSDSTGNRLYLGTTGGGVWVAQNAGTSNASSVVFTPLTDALGALNGVTDPSISIGALSVQPDSTGVILAGTGDPNDVLDSPYGGGILRSTDSGNTWSLISRTRDVEQGLGVRDVRFLGEGFAGFTWSTVNPQLVVAAVSQAYEGAVVNAVQLGNSYQGLYYSPDSGATWLTATITDGNGRYVQGPLAAFAAPDGNAATSVVWNPIRHLFFAALRFHGYYQSADGITWTRVASQPGAGLTSLLCPTSPGSIGSIACPIYRGTLAVNPSTGDTFAWTVDLNDQDQGLWQDQCSLSGGTCTNQAIAFARKWNTSSLESNTSLGAATIADGSYTLALAAIPAGLGAGQDTLLLAGTDDLWKCSLAAGCVWRNTTNTSTCKSAQVGEFQHSIAWNPANPLEIFAGNDSGLWRSTDAIGESGQTCSSSDSQHFQNMNGSLGSLAEVVSLSGPNSSPSEMMVGLGVNGTAGVKSNPTAADWPQILGGYGGPVAIDSTSGDKWYANTQAGVAIYKCAQSADCTAVDFGTSPVVSNADVGGDGLTMPSPAPFLVDPLDASQLLIGTCRVWRGPVDGSSWSSNNALSPVLDSRSASGACAGNALIRSISAAALPGGVERIYLGMYGSLTSGAKLPGHVLSATINPAASTPPVWTDLTLSPVVNDVNALNKFGMDVSSIFIDSHDATGNTAYVTIEGTESAMEPIQVVYRTTDGGLHWTDLTSNLPDAPASSIVVDPQDANTAYIATDVGVYFTNQVASCAVASSNCWALFGTGLPASPVVALSISSAGASSPVLVAGTYGRGIWQAPLHSVVTIPSSASANPTALTFLSQALGTTSGAQAVTLQNTGTSALAVTAIAVSGDFSETDNCVNASIPAAASCTIQVRFTPSAAGGRTGQMTISANISGGQLTVDLTGAGLAAGVVTLTPPSLDFGQVAVDAMSAPLSIMATNTNGSPIAISSLVVAPPFSIASNSCGTSSLAALTSCQIQLKFDPTAVGPATGMLTLIDSAGTQNVILSGSGAAAATESLSPTALNFSATPVNTLSVPQTITLTNAGDLLLTAIAVSVSGPYQTSSTCGTQLTGQASCTISVIFAPTQVGSQPGTVSVSDSLRTQSVALTGAGVAPPSLSVNPASFNFSGQQAGTASAPQILSVVNAGGAPMANIGFQISGPAAPSYSISATTCGATLNAGASCTAQVIFNPTGIGAIAATLIISSSTIGVAPLSVPLDGTGQVSSGMSFTPSQLNFSAVGVGQTSSAQQIAISNGSSYVIASLTIMVSPPFSLSQNSCTGTLAAGASCAASVTFQPTSSGTARGTLTVTSSVLQTPASVALSGIGFDFAAAVSGSSTFTVAAGQTANYAFMINPASAAAGSFTYTCSALPANAQCVFNPATTTISAGATGNIAVAISTGKAGTARLETPARWRMIPMTCGLLFLPLLLVRLRKSLIVLVLLAVMTSLTSSCSSSGGGSGGGAGGGTGGTGGGSATPPGTYSIPVTISSTGVSHVVTVTLTVD